MSQPPLRLKASLQTETRILTMPTATTPEEGAPLPVLRRV